MGNDLEVKYTLNTNINRESGEITQNLSLMEDHIKKVSTIVIRTRDAQVRQALIDLGWIPPKELTYGH